MNIDIEIAKEYEPWSSMNFINNSLFQTISGDILARYPAFKEIKTVEISILLTNDSRMKSLNTEFRDSTKATNVLSFPDLEINYQQLFEFKTDANYLYLGDIAFGYETILREAEECDISFINHFKHLFVHSMLHLLGYDHVKDLDAKIMEELEIKILKDYNIESPYE